ncbi:MAG TPA: head GIN domain-containing protein [Draconibacterium sp.]|jgi:hypothetical protein|nr:head GIN domain-containing protein [Draconibacterium sp.]
MKRKFFITIIVIAIFSVTVFAQEEDSWPTKTFSIGEFTQIKLDGGFKVYLIQGDECSITVKTSNDDVFDNLKIKNYQSEVFIQMDASFFKYRRVSLYITFKTLEKLTIEGGVNLKTNGYLDLNNFAVHIEGGANIDLDMKAQNVDVYGEGGFLFEMKGVADKLNVTIKGAGHVSASELKTKDVSFIIAGFGTGSVYATNTLYAKIEGVGKLRYKGEPKVDQYIDGLGSVKPY